MRRRLRAGPRPVVNITITGPAGSGKTTFAVATARLLRSCGATCVNLRDSETTRAEQERILNRLNIGDILFDNAEWEISTVQTKKPRG